MGSNPIFVETPNPSYGSGGGGGFSQEDFGGGFGRENVFAKDMNQRENLR